MLLGFCYIYSKWKILLFWTLDRHESYFIEDHMDHTIPEYLVSFLVLILKFSILLFVESKGYLVIVFTTNKGIF